MRLPLLLAALLLPGTALAQTVTANLPAVVNPQGQPRPVPAGFTLNADGSIQNIGPSTAASAAITPAVGSLVAGLVGKAAPGNAYSFEVVTGAAAAYLYGFNSTTIPADGTVTAGTAAGNYQFCQPIAATTGARFGYETPERYSSGITLAVSSTACGTLTKIATAVFLKVRAQ